MPAVVMAACILLYIGGAELAFYALLDVRAVSGVILNSLSMVGQGVYGVLIIGLTGALHLRLRSARYIAIAWCLASLALATISMDHAGLRGLTQIVAPVIYLALLTRPSARMWFGSETPQANEV